MIDKLIILLLILFASVEFTHAQTGQKIEKSEIIENIKGKDYYLHFVESGETLFGIATAYGIRVDEIFKENPQSQKGIRPGIVLKIPLKNQSSATEKVKPSESPNSSFYYHIVQKQETFYGIAKKYSITVDQLKELNPQVNETLKEGQTLKVPALNESKISQRPPIEGTTIHIVEQGETLYSIARKYQVTNGQIYNLNPQLKDNINIGDEIIIPKIENQKEETSAELKNDDEPVKRVHQVVAGETLYSIAQNYALSIDSIFYYNAQMLGNPQLKIGQEISLPPAKKTSEFIVHKSAKKQSLDKISEMYQVEYEKIVKMNPGISRKAKKGQNVRIPVDPILVDEKSSEEENEIAGNITLPCDKSYSPGDKTFNVALMLPFYLEELDSIPPAKSKDMSSLESFRSLRFINFYAGFQKALDSIRRQGMNVNLFVYDVDNSTEKTQKVLHASELSGMDLIVGPLFGKSFQTIAQFANTYEIPMVNPLSEREEIVMNNPWVYKVKPSLEYQNEQVVSYVLNNYADHNIILVRHNTYKYQAEISFIRNSINRSRPAYLYLGNENILNKIKTIDRDSESLLTENKLFKVDDLKSNLSDSSFISNMVKEVIYVNDSAKGIAQNLSMIRPNLVIATSDDIVFSKDLLSQLNKLNQDHKITLFGMPDWMSFGDLETNHLLNLNFHCFSTSIVNYSSPNVKKWISEYREQYSTEPASYNYAFDGFDVGWYFLNALYRLGPDFTNCTQDFKLKLIQNRFDFKQKPFNGFQNTHWNIGSYKNYRLVQINNEVYWNEIQ